MCMAWLRGKSNQGIAGRKVVDAGPGLGQEALHFIFGNQDRRLVGQQGGEIVILQFISGGGAAEQDALGRGQRAQRGKVRLACARQRLERHGQGAGAERQTRRGG